MYDFLRRCQNKKSEVMLCPRCSAVFDKKEAQNLKGVRRVNHQNGRKAVQNHQVVQPIRAFDLGRYHDPRRPMVKLGEARRIGPTTKPISFKPSVKGTNGKWVKPTDARKCGQGKWQSFEVERGSSLAYRKEFWADKRTSDVFKNYKGKNAMTRSQWRREKKRRKAQREASEKDKVESSTNLHAKQREDSSFIRRKLNDTAEAMRKI